MKIGQVKRNGSGEVEFTTNELQIIERLLSNRLNADFDPDVNKLLHKVRIGQQEKEGQRNPEGAKAFFKLIDNFCKEAEHEQE